MSAAELADVVVVGSGCAGATAATTLVEAGARVLMLDVGLHDEHYRALLPAKDFLSIRRTEREQHRFFLGDDLEGIPRRPISSGAQLTPPRQHLVARVDELLPRRSADFAPLESLAYGGLGAGWGLGCNVFSPPELDAAGLDAERMRAAYAVVARRVGVSGARDDAGPYACAALEELLPPSETDRNGRALLARYARRRAALNRRGFHLGRPALALLTRDQDGRGATRYRDMDFYEDLDRSGYRPWFTVDRLRTRPGFEYRAGQLALSFRASDDGVEVECLDVATGARRVARGRRLVLAAGVLGTARIVLRSLPGAGALPLLCNPYSYVACLQLATLGAAPDARRTSLAQAMLFHDPRGDHLDVAQASIYSYGSLLLFRLAADAPLPFADGRVLLRYLAPALVIAGIHHPEAAPHGGRMRLVPNPASPTGDRLAIDYPTGDERRAALRARERAYVGALRRLGCHALRRVALPMGASVHYGGCLPFSTEERPFTLTPAGRLRGAPGRVYVGDASGFGYLPAKGLTLSLMANAHRVAEEVLRDA